MKSPEEIIEQLIDDTMSNKLHWSDAKNGDYIYCIFRTDKKGTIIDSIFKIFDNSAVGNDGMYYTGYEDDTITLDIYMRKNNNIGKEKFCVRIKDYQLKLIELLNVVLHNKRKNISDIIKVGDKVKITNSKDKYEGKFGIVRSIENGSYSIQIGFDKQSFSIDEIEKNN